jgi:hypothetical protein
MKPELLAALAVELPAGELIVSEEGRGEDQPLWLDSYHLTVPGKSSGRGRAASFTRAV